MIRRILLIGSILGILCGSAAAQQTKTESSAPTKTLSGMFGNVKIVLTQSDPSPAVKKQALATDTSAAKNVSSASSAVLNNLGNNIKQTLGFALETFMPFQFKYAIMLNESVEKLSNAMLYKTIDDWYGTRYRYGGTTSRGIDCSAFMQVLSHYAFGWILPRTAREQYASMQKINKEDLREGDFVFFNTRGGISHVGMYLQNGKFIHSSSSQGVVISDLDDKYWSARFLGARRAVDENTYSRQGNNMN